MSTKDLWRDCVAKRDDYQHAKAIYGEAIRLGLSAWTDMTALRGELEAALVAYYAAHSAMHLAMARPATAPTRLH